MKLLKQILTAFALITLASCQSVDYYGKSYEKNGFFHCMMLEYSVFSVPKDEQISCSNYKEKLQKTISDYSLLQEKNYYEQYGAICKSQKDILECSYDANLLYVGAYYSVFHKKIKISNQSNIKNTQFKINKQFCDADFSVCDGSAFSYDSEFTINKIQ